MYRYPPAVILEPMPHNHLASRILSEFSMNFGLSRGLCPSLFENVVAHITAMVLCSPGYIISCIRGELEG